MLALVLAALLTGVFVGLGSPRGRGRGRLAPAAPDVAALPGGDPSRALPAASPAVIERSAERWPCPRCGSPVYCETHRAERIGERRLRVARPRCARCGFERDIYFELHPNTAGAGEPPVH